MAVDTRKLKDQANELALKGKNKDAIALLDQVIKADKTDVKSMVKLGDLYKKMSQTKEAVAAYTMAARLYAAQGFLVNAISVNKMILELDPNHKEVQEALADLYAKREQTAAPAGAGGQVKGASLELLEQFRKKPKDAPAAAPAGAAAPAAPAAAPAEEEGEAEDILASLPQIPLFSHLTRDEFISIIDQLQIQVYEPNDLVISEGDHGDSFFVINRGTAAVTKKDPKGKEIEVATLNEGNFFGEFAFLADSDRRASVIAKTELEVLEFSRTKLDQLIRKHPRVKEVMLEFYRERVMSTLLTISPLFQPFNEEEKNDLIRKFVFAEMPPKGVIIQENTDGDGLYLIMSGEVEVTKAGADGKPVPLAVLKEGDFFGEMSLLLRQKTTATVTAKTKASLFKLPKQVFNEVILTHPQILEVVGEFIEARQQSNQKMLGNAAGAAQAGMV